MIKQLLSTGVSTATSFLFSGSTKWITIIASGIIVSLLIYIFVQKASISSYKTDIAEQKTKITALDARIVQLKQINSSLKTSISNIEKINNGKDIKITSLNDEVVYWKSKYLNEPKIIVKEVSSKEYIQNGTVIDEESSKNLIKYFNDNLFK